jgi:hypothetical protein
MATIDPLTAQENMELGFKIERNLLGQVRTIIAPFNLVQINNPRFPKPETAEFISVLEYAYHTSSGPNGAKTIKEILKKNPTFSARIFFVPARRDLIVASDIFSYHTVGEAGHPNGGIRIDDLTAEEKGKLIVILALRYPSKKFGYGAVDKSYPSDASVLVRKLLDIDPPVEDKYINAALYYVRHPLPRKAIGPGHYTLETDRFETVLTDGGATNIAAANINQGLLTGTATNQVTYKTKANSIASKVAAAAAKAAAAAARLATMRANIGAHIKTILKENILEIELLEYLHSPEGAPKLKENKYKIPGIEVSVTILEFAIFKNMDLIVDGLLTMPDILDKIDKTNTIIKHAVQLDRLMIKNYTFIKYIESPLFTIAGLPNNFLYSLLSDAVVLTIPVLVSKIFEERGVNPVSLDPDVADPPLDPTKLNIYYVYYFPDAFNEQYKFMTLYQLAEKTRVENYFYAQGAREEDAETIKTNIAEVYHGNITAKEQAAIARKREAVTPLAPDFLMPPPGPFRDGDPETEARAVAAAHAHEVLWKGFSKTDELYLKDIFKPDIVVPGETTQRPSIDAGFCPVCLVFIPHGQACIYMSHICNPTDIINKTLYNKYKNEFNKIYWCTICNRPCNSHGHFKVSNMFGPVPANAPNYTGIEIYGQDCRNLGGGGLLEKMGRFDALRKEAKALLPLLGTISHKEARLRLGKAFWNAPITDYRASATALLTAAGWENDPFPEIDEGPPVASANIPYTGGTLLEGELTNEIMTAENLHVGDVLLPEIKREPTEAFNTLEIANPVIRYRHRKPDGVINLHVGEYSSIPGIFNSVASHSTTTAEAEGTFGKCPICPAIIHPDEIKYILDELLFDVD